MRPLRNKSAHFSPDIWRVCQAVAAWAIERGYRGYDKQELANITWLIQGRYMRKADYVNCKRALSTWLWYYGRRARRDRQIEREYARAVWGRTVPAVDEELIRQDEITALRSRLSGREKKMFDLCLQGARTPQIGAALGITKKRARQLRAALFLKLKENSND